MTYTHPSRIRAMLALACVFTPAFTASLLTLAAPAAVAADATKKSFDIPAGDAAATLKQFTTQAGEQLLYSMDAVKGVASNAVKGDMSPRQALDQMFAGTRLSVVQDRSNGALSLVRASDPNVPRAAQATTGPRPNPSTSSSTNAGDETITLSPFTITEDQDTGYVATSSLAGSRMNTALRDTAASLSVLTKEFLDDIGATSVADAMAWSTNSQLNLGDTLTLANVGDDVNATFFGFESFRVRGVPSTLTRDYFDWALPTDTYNSDRVEEARGPNSILFGIGSAGGVINSSTKRANLSRDFRSGTIGISTYGGYRGTIDLNQRFGRRLAVRINGVYDKTESWRDHNFSQKQMAAIAATFKVTDKTTLRAEYETGRTRDNVGPNQHATEIYSNWVNAGSRLISAPIAANQNTAFGVTRLAATTRVTYIGNTNTVMNMANQYVSSGLDYAIPPHIVPYTISGGGPGAIRRPHFDTVTVSLDQQIGRNTFVELAYNHQQFQTWNQQEAAGRVFIDVNTTLPTGQPNPHVGQHYIEAETWVWDYGRRTDNTRLSIAHELDVGKWGRYRFAAMGEYNWRSPKNAQLFEVWADRPYGATLENQANAVTRRQYVTFGDWGNYYIRNPMAFGLIRGLTDPVTGRTLNSTWVPRNLTGLRDNPEKQKSVLLATQARYFKDRLVLGLGFRADKLDTITRGTTRDANGMGVIDYANNTFAKYDGRTKTLGAVFHLTKNLSVFYNQSDNFGLPPTIFLVPDGRRAGNPEGQGNDYGIVLTLFDGKLVARANYYKTDLANGTNSNYGGTTTAPDAVGDAILNALVAQNLITAAEADTHRVVNTGATYAQLVEGYEFNLTANPTRNWRLQANFSYTDGYTSEVAPEVQVWAAREIPFFRRFDQNIAASGGTIGQLLRNWEDYNNQQLELVGLTLAGNRKYKVNLFTSYSFSEGFLKGLRVGGGYRHQSKLPIGQYPDKSLQYGPSWWDSSAMIGYRFAQSPLPWIKRLGLQLNVNNVFDENDPYVTRRVQGTNPEIVRRIRVREPRTWRLTASFDF
jgi:iron complex outermembrane receptor protein